jgi:hypothetical protein
MARLAPSFSRMGFDRVYPVYYEISFELETDLIINWIYPIKTHSRETWGKSTSWPTQTLSAHGTGWHRI